ncbi:LysR family transcriptional regulator [Pseudodonghicola flavimaris]|uniref:LysR family transcriptional regulator n=1 Tax=Pseudodonghicola flavimaris TaxID=3050036 RepID=A0ABT7EY78_9RHOB|nr:LysR family transcriptional regulator [Pseudodonghicola flavimaris]MDK3017296.1 LysR family transcriptional regulator [Pseudodonghicola flavimaris]
MKLSQIRYFIAIAELQHFGRAADLLRIAQPALSRQMKLLEDEIGVTLFERLPRGVRLTPAGEVFLTQLKPVEARIERAVAAARAAASGAEGQLSLGLIEVSAWSGIVPQTIQEFRQRFAGVELNLLAMSSGEQMAALRTGKLDASIIYNPQPEPGLTLAPLALHRLMLAVPAGDPMADRPTVRMADLAGAPLIGFRRASSPQMYDDVTAALTAAGHRGGFHSEMTNESDILALVNSGLGMAIVNENQRLRPPPAVRFIPVPDLDVRLRLCLVWPEGAPSPTRDRFIDLMLARRDPAAA